MATRRRTAKADPLNVYAVPRQRAVERFKDRSAT